MRNFWSGHYWCLSASEGLGGSMSSDEARENQVLHSSNLQDCRHV
jgi:hypothetical protein